VGATVLSVVNHEHHHRGLNLLTPATVHHGHAEAVWINPPTAAPAPRVGAGRRRRVGNAVTEDAP
jgi:hypothetical protein